MPCTDVFDAQDDTYKESVLPSDVQARVAVEAGVSGYWIRYVGLGGKVVGIDRFGESAPGGVVMEYLGITAENVAKSVQAVLG
jgi:transketolase